MSERPSQTQTIVQPSQGAGASAVPGQSGSEPAPQASQPAAAPTQQSMAVVPPSQPSFPVTRRGYDTASVDRKVSALLREKAALLSALDEARSHAERCHEETHDQHDHEGKAAEGD